MYLCRIKMLLMKKSPIGILCAMQEEVADILKCIENAVQTEIGCRTYYKGTICEQEVVVVFSRWGKVGAATTTTMLIDHFKVSEIIFVGTAGALNAELNVGDIVIGKQFLQHDFNCAPILKPYELPFINRRFLEAADIQVQKAEIAVSSFLQSNNFTQSFSQEQRELFHLQNPKYKVGQIASGDSFFSTDKQKQELLEKFPSLLCVEMEGASVAQVCYEYEIPLTVIRVISDSANDNATIDFNKFIKEVAANYSKQIVLNLLNPTI